MEERERVVESKGFLETENLVVIIRNRKAWEKQKRVSRNIKRAVEDEQGETIQTGGKGSRKKAWINDREARTRREKSGSRYSGMGNTTSNGEQPERAWKSDIGLVIIKRGGEKWRGRKIEFERVKWNLLVYYFFFFVSILSIVRLQQYRKVIFKNSFW